MIKKLRGKNLIILILCLVFLLGFVKSANSEEYNETLARERLNMVKPGEKVINDKKGDSTSKN